MGLAALYQLVDQGKLEEGFLTLDSYHGEERLEGELWKAYFLLEVYGELEQTTTLVEKVYAKCRGKIRFESFARLQYAFIFLWKGKYKEGHAELKQVEELLSALSEEDQFNVRRYYVLLWLAKGLYSFYQGNYEQSVINYSQGWQIATEKTFPLKSLVPIIYNNISLVYAHKGDFNNTVAYLNKSLITSRGLDNDIMQAAPLSILGACYMNQGNITRALEYAQKAFELAQKKKCKTIIAWTLSTLGQINRIRGDLKQAEEYHLRALTLCEGLKNPHYVVDALNFLGRLYLTLRNLKQAEKYFLRAFTLCEELDNPQESINSLYSLGSVYYFLGDLNKAEKYLQRGLTLNGEFDFQRIDLLNLLGELFRLRGEMDKAETFYQRALTISEKKEHKLSFAMIQANLGHVYWHRGELTKAEEACRRAIISDEEMERLEWLAESLALLVQILLAQERLDEATAEVNRLGDLAQTKKMQILEVWHQVAQSRVYLKQYNLALALQTATEAKIQAAAINQFELLIEAMKLSMRGQLQLYMYSKKEEYKTQLEVELQELSRLSKREYLYSVYIETLLVQGMLKRAEFDLPGAIQQFEQVKTLATKRGLYALAQKAQIEIRQLHKQAEFLQRMMAQAPEAYKHMQMEAMQIYLESAMEYVRQKG